MKLRIGISPCPNDTFIFDAIYSKQIDISPFEFEFIFEDVETLNQLALESKLDIIKLSYANYFNVLDNYIMLRSGGALGNKVGPILVSKKNYHLTDIDSLTVAIPGINTTANFLLTYAFPFLTKKTAFVFGNERFGMDPQVIEACHETRKVPLSGIKNSLNVANAASIFIYEFAKQYHELTPTSKPGGLGKP